MREDQKQWLKPMVRQFPSVTLLDISEVMQRVRGIIDRASIALQFFFAFAMMAAVIVLMSALNTANPDRQREIALLIALGAGGRQKLSSQLFEFLLMGVLVGLFAALFATLTANFIGFRFFDLPLSLQPQMWIYSVSSAVLFIAGFGMLFIYRSFESTPMKLLRS